MKQYLVKSTFISTFGLMILCILVLVNAVASLFLSVPFHEGWFAILTSIFLLAFLVGILIESRTVKSFKVSSEKVIYGSKVLNPDDLIKITITHKQIELTQAERTNFKKLLLIRLVNAEELKSLTEELSEFAKEHKITIENHI